MEANVLRRGEIDNDTIPDWVGLFRSADNFMISGLDFERLLFDEAAEAFKEAYSRRLMGLTSFWFPGCYVYIS